MSQPTLVETRDLCKYYRPTTKAEVRALDGVSMAIPPGSFTVLTGPSGSGKTTLLALLGALERPTRGLVFFQGRNLAVCSDVELARLRRRMGFVFQDFSLIARLPVWENITYPLIPRGVSGPERWKIAQNLLTRLGLPEKTWMHPHELSGGEQQRIALARALAGQPELVLADEPISNLDPKSGREVIGQLQEFHREGKTVIVSSHDEAVIALAERVIELAAGKVVS